MGSKHKEAQAARRIAREKGAEYRRQFMARLAFFNDILKPRPSWCHPWVWQHLANLFIDSKKLEERINADAKMMPKQ